jgi:DNA-binding HxlR family transcriptional regulator
MAILAGLVTALLILVAAAAGILSIPSFVALLLLGGGLSAALVDGSASRVNLAVGGFAMTGGLGLPRLENRQVAIKEVEAAIAALEARLDEARDLEKKLSSEKSDEASEVAGLPESASTRLSRSGGLAAEDWSTLRLPLPFETEKLSVHRRTAGIVAALSEHPLRFWELEQAVSDISPRLLSIRLRELEEEDLVDRQVDTSHNIQVTYSLTDSGLALASVLQALRAWAAISTGKARSEKDEAPSRRGGNPPLDR